MAQYAEGQRLKGSDGNIYVVRNGVPVRADAPASSPFAKPGLQYEGPQAQANLTRTQQEIAQANATAAANAAKARAEAESARIKALNDKEAYDAAHVPVGQSGLYGNDFLKTLPTPDQKMVVALAEGRLAFPSSFALRSPYWQTKLQQVAQYDPNFDATNYNARAKARANAIAGKLGQSNNALNTAVGHLGTLYSQIDGTASHGGFPFATDVNAVENYFSKHSGNAGVTNFNDTATKLADELEAVYRNGGGAEQGVVRQLRNLDPNMSREQKMGVIQNAVDLLASKMAANLSQYNFGTGGKPSWEMLDPHAAQVIQAISPGSLQKYFATDQGGITPPGTGNTNLDLKSSTDGFSDTPDPQSAAFWENAARNRTPYTQALSDWRQSVQARGLQGATPPPPGAYGKAVDQFKQHPNVEYHPFTAITRSPLSMADEANTALASTGPVAGIGHFADAGLAGLPSAMAGDQGQFFNQVSRAEHPVYSALGDIGGAIAGTVGINRGLKAGGEAIADFAPGLSKYFAKPGLRSAAADTLFGGTYGATQNPDNRLAGAAIGVASMLAGNAVGRYALGPGIAFLGTTRPGKAIGGMFGGPPPVPPLPGGDGMIAGATAKTGSDILANLDEASSLGLPYSLADSNPQLRVLAGSAVRKSPAVRQLAEDTIAPRQLGQADRAISGIDTHLAPVTNIEQRGADLLKAGDQAAGPSYSLAMDRPGPVDPQLVAMLDTPAGKASLAHARTIAANEGVDPNKLGFDLNDQGEVVLKSVPSFRTLQLVKRGMDAHLNSLADQFGNLNLRGNPLAQSVLDLKNRFNTRLGELNPDYAEGNNIWSGYAQRKDALDRGYNVMSNNAVPQRQFDAAMSGLTPDTLPEAQLGFATRMADTANKARMTSDPYNVIYGSPLQQRKVAALFPEGSSKFNRLYNLERDMARTAHETLGGSPTAARVQADNAFDGPGGAAADLAFTAATGTPTPSLIARAGRMGMDYLRLGRGVKRADEIGPILLDTDTAKSAAYLRNLTDLAAARREYLARARAAGGMFGAPLALPFIPNQ